ncbi:MAG: coproporphyrinogen dehydrogenase HemZ [Candidatus Cellulosilyticum pullistercoris]|uniref:Coproporphyrinogen dehydrogenase HemZ n=1 Tax=Candidatus Cellulosilyticum pullistercoris TaxID=2838521 RepID=A0A9E2KBJ1_9FIRM|nr:coproporphyrinogen dehydrogenase HemZ [Candidatus Cellulosilyticum pullistercoris]
MIELLCEGHEASYELTNVMNLFLPYIKDSLLLQTIYDGEKSIARLKQEAVVLYEQVYPVNLLGDAIRDKKAIKESLKKAVYDVLVAYTGKTMPWGILTGIRPTKLVHEAIKEGLNDAEIDAYLDEAYKVSPNKRVLMREVAKQELAILEKNQPDEVSIYIGIPFCPTRCVYCSFTAYSLEQMQNKVEPYLEALFKEISFVAEAKKNMRIRSLYIGGGTPTSLNEDQLDRLLSHVEKCFNLSQIEEYTLEAGRPDTINAEKLRIMKAHGVGRISINPQSMNQKTLDAIGRRHSVEDIREVFRVARELGHNNINMDMILGLPGEDLKDVAYTLAELKKLGPENITVHTMAIKRASKLKEALTLDEASIHLTEGEKIQEMLNLCEMEMSQMGLYPYYMYRQKNMLGNFENVGYAKPGTEGIYNIEIMEEAESIIALGAGAITKMVYQNGERIDRIPNVKSLKDYIERIDEMIERKREGFEKYR